MTSVLIKWGNLNADIHRGRAMWRDTKMCVKQKCLRLPDARGETWHRYFPSTFRGSMTLLISFLATPTVRQ